MKTTVAKSLRARSDIEQIVHDVQEAATRSFNGLGEHDAKLHLVLREPGGVIGPGNLFSTGGMYIKRGNRAVVLVHDEPYSEQKEVIQEVVAHELLHGMRDVKGVAGRRIPGRLGVAAIEEGVATHFGLAILHSISPSHKAESLERLNPAVAAGFVLRDRVQDFFKLAIMYGSNTPHVVGYNALRPLIDISVIDPEMYLADCGDIRGMLSDLRHTGVSQQVADV